MRWKFWRKPDDDVPVVRDSPLLAVDELARAAAERWSGGWFDSDKGVHEGFLSFRLSFHKKQFLQAAEDAWQQAVRDLARDLDKRKSR